MKFSMDISRLGWFTLSFYGWINLLKDRIMIFCIIGLLYLW